MGNGVLKSLLEEFSLGHEHYQNELEEIKSDYQEQIKQAEADSDAAKAEELRSELSEQSENLKEEMSEGGYTAWEDFMSKWNEHLSQCLSPMRTADIGDMIVEVDSRYIEGEALSLEQAVCSLKKGPFTLATEDEWEYLCNGGTRTLFRWGDTMDNVITEIYNIGTSNQSEEKSILGQPNMLGLLIAYDSYKNEIIDHTLYTKGGDGGCSLCGGNGAIYVLPCYTAFYRQSMDDFDDTSLEDGYFCYRQIIRLP